VDPQPWSAPDLERDYKRVKSEESEDAIIDEDRKAE
jgi:hypothetical protein